MNAPTILSTAALAAVLVAASVHMPGRVTVVYDDVDGCQHGCEVAAGGWPLAFVADYPGLSVADDVSLWGVADGSDRLLAGRAAVAAMFWFAVSAAALTAVRRARRSLA